MKIESRRAEFLVYVISSSLAVLDRARENLYRAGYEVEFFSVEEGALGKSVVRAPDLVVVDLENINWSLEDLIQSFREFDPTWLAIGPLFDKHKSMYLREHGLFDFIDRMHLENHLVWACDNALEVHSLKRENVELRSSAAETKRLDFSKIGANMFKYFKQAENRKDLVRLCHHFLREMPGKVVYLKLLLPKYIFLPTDVFGFEETEVKKLGLKLHIDEARQLHELLAEPEKFTRLTQFLKVLGGASQCLAVHPVWFDRICDGVLVVYGPSDVQMSSMDALIKLFELHYELVRHLKHIDRNAWLDLKTGLLQKKYFLERFEQEIQRGLRIRLPVGILRIELGKRTEIEKKMGSDFLQVLSNAMAALLKKTSRVHDLTTEMAAGVFVSILPHTNLQGTEVRAERIRRVLSEGLRDSFQQIELRFFVGAAEHPKSGRSGEQILLRLKESTNEKHTKNGETICSISEPAPQ